MENEFKRITQETEEKLEKVKSEYVSISGKYNDVIHKLSSFIYENENLARENQQLKTLFSEIVAKNPKKQTNNRKKKKGYQSTDKKKGGHHYNPSNYIKLSVSKKKESYRNASISIPFNVNNASATKELKRKLKNSFLNRSKLYFEQELKDVAEYQREKEE